MDNLLTNPLIQSAVAPFVVSLVVALVFRPHGWYWAGLAAVAGYAVSVYLISGFQLFPLRADRKIIIIACGALLLGVLFDLLSWRRALPGVLFVAGAAAAVWLLWPRLRGDGEWHFWLLAGGGILYTGWLLAASIGLKDRALQVDSMVFALALGTGLAALLGATALYGQLGSAIAAAVGARLLLHLFGRPVAAGALMVLPLVAVLALLGVGAMVYSKLPWYTLVILALLPLLVRLPLGKGWPRLAQLLVSVAVTGGVAAVAIYLTWLKTGAPPI